MSSRRGGSTGRARRRANEAMRKIDRALEQGGLSKEARSALKKDQRILKALGSARSKRQS